jgi:predicted GNAT family acetyltransferase
VSFGYDDYVMYAIDEEDDTHLERWTCVLRWSDPDEDSDSDDSQTIGTAVVCRVYAQDMDSAYELLDSDSAHLEAIGARIFHDAKNVRKRVPRVDLDGNFLIVETVEIDEDFRGQGLGPGLVARALARLGRGVSFAALIAYPNTADRPDPASAEFKPISAKIRGAWAGLGFKPAGGDLMIADLESVDVNELLYAAIAL